MRGAGWAQRLWQNHATAHCGQAGEALLPEKFDSRGRAIPTARLRATGFVAHATMVYDELTAEENLLLFARLQGIARPERASGKTASRSWR